MTESPVLVTGATGQLGTHFISHLNESGIVPRALVRQRYPDEAWGPYRVRTVTGDIAPADAGASGEAHERALATLERLLDGIDTVYHLAAYVHVGTRHRKQHERVNVQGTKNLYRAAMRAQVRRIVHVSSIVTIGASADGAPLDETSTYNLAPFENPYFDTKRESEQWILGAARTSPGSERGAGARPAPEVVVVCPAINFGERKAIRSRAAQIRGGNEPSLLSVTERPSWMPWMRAFPFRLPVRVNLADAGETARGILAAGERGRPGERYILGGANLDYGGIVSILREFFPVARPVIPVPASLLAMSGALSEAMYKPFGKRPKWDRRRAALARFAWHYDASKAARELGWVHRPIRETVAHILGPLC
ncbi:MAG: NAD-dependent epimerase/dehydratase family protein [Gemmatimonadetes bacterium]|nr:NAD-dependent epimerase/dehydratase family protein [Gemmatimonadota bacterium]